MIFVTGGSGFVGGYLIRTIYKNYNVSGAFRTSNVLSKFIKPHIIPKINIDTEWGGVLTGAECVIHLAGLAHGKNDDLDEFINVNTAGSLKLAKDASVAGVRRFIFISSIGVNGTSNNHPFKVEDNPSPKENYAISKYEAEIGLKKIAEDTGMEVVIIRPPLIYGKGAPGNFASLLKVAEKNLLLPLGAIKNQRSFVAIDNLIDLIVTCIDHPDAANQTFLVSDDENVSTSDFLKKLISATGKKPRLLAVPVFVLKFLASIVGKKSTVERFSDSLTVDIEHTKKTLNWIPPVRLDEGIRRCFK
ncbi:NAD-dependent epimerase/dehydratase family protein [Pseudoalteromonas sp. NEC-BIFX-2020_002]|uniref:NAD-dependent epimerase/dehydratase family protein n=1 Tax=Pseudoalteromonas sp. NEC-BIFX-2020_002 TaxID=2732353 RepID=UPI001476EBCB|nr:NAD-dependent epimerase/dehydratase family protein [Pseudoalteromonas sp. NEC-BIFX-2020_002]